jgi:nicotinamidase-related amidase
MKQALLVIDVQQGLCEGEGQAWQFAQVIARINRVSDKARLAGVPVIFVQHEGRSGYLGYGSRAWQLADGLVSEAQDIRIRKTTSDAFLGTELQQKLGTLGVKELIICGMHSEFCVDTTTRRALALGYPVILLEDAHTSAGNNVLSAEQVIAHHNATLTNISSFGPKARTVSSWDMAFG